MATPPTPAHVLADEEVELPSGPISLNLELNPDLEDDDDNYMNPQEDLASAHDEPQNYNISSHSNSGHSLAPPSPEIEIQSWTLSLDTALDNVKKDFANNQKHKEISPAQQSMFINYVDSELLQIQRKFIKNQAEVAQVYSISELISDVSRIADLIWYSFEESHSLFGQDEYLIRILGDLEDWVSYYSFPDFTSDRSASIAFHARYFVFCQSLDARISLLIDGCLTDGSPAKMSATEVVRLSPIVMRLRTLSVSKVQDARAGLLATRGTENADELLNILDLEIGRLFEGILERI